MSEDGSRSPELAAMAEMTKALIALTTEVGQFRHEFTTMQIDIAIMKERQTNYAELRERIEKMERRDAEQDGAYKGLHFLKDFGPWLAALTALAWGFLARSPK